MRLQKTIADDLETLFVFQADEKSNYIAAFNTPDPTDKQTYMEKWTKIVANPAINMQTIFVDDILMGSVAHFEIEDETNVSYWIDRRHWGKGIATHALQQLLANTDKKILYARIAYDNIGSQKVLERNGFVRVATDKGFANGRGKEIEEYVYRLEL